MAAQEWIEEGAYEARDFNLYGGVLTLANVGDAMYVELTGEDGSRLSFPVESKENLRIAHWIIKEFA